jgi:hypothetical protein
MSFEPRSADAGARPGMTLTQVLALGRRVVLYGHKITDLVPYGDLGIGLDPEGPVGFALVRGYRRNDRFTCLPEPVVLSVFGNGRPAAADDGDAHAGEHLWTMAAADRALQLRLQPGTVGTLLQLDAD